MKAQNAMTCKRSLRLLYLYVHSLAKNITHKQSKKHTHKVQTRFSPFITKPRSINYGESTLQPKLGFYLGIFPHWTQIPRLVLTVKYRCSVTKPDRSGWLSNAKMALAQYKKISKPNNSLIAKLHNASLILYKERYSQRGQPTRLIKIPAAS